MDRAKSSPKMFRDRTKAPLYRRGPGPGPGPVLKCCLKETGIFWEETQKHSTDRDDWPSPMAKSVFEKGYNRVAHFLRYSVDSLAFNFSCTLY